MVWEFYQKNVAIGDVGARDVSPTYHNAIYLPMFRVDGPTCGLEQNSVNF